MSDPCLTNDCVDAAVAKRWSNLKLLVPLLAALLFLPSWISSPTQLPTIAAPTPYPEYQVAEAQIPPTVIVNTVVEAAPAIQLTAPPVFAPTAVPAPVAVCPLILGQNTDDNSQALPGFFGTGNTDTRLEILEDGVVIGHATVQADGSWRCACQLSPGDHTLTIREQGSAGCAEEQITINILSKAPAYIVPAVSITRDPSAGPFTCPDGSPAGQIEGTLYRVGCGETMGEIAQIVGTTFGELLAFNPQVPNVSAIYTGQLLNIPLNASCFDEVIN